MKLLHKKSILECSELDEKIHQAEMNQLMDMLLSLPNYDWDIEVSFEDDYHKDKREPLFYESNLHRIFEFIEAQDIKNGVDTFLTDEHHLAFRAYGQGYFHKGKEGLITSLLTVKCFEEGMVPVDMSKYLLSPASDLEPSLTLEGGADA